MSLCLTHGQAATLQIQKWRKTKNTPTHATNATAKRCNWEILKSQKQWTTKNTPNPIPQWCFTVSLLPTTMTFGLFADYRLPDYMWTQPKYDLPPLSHYTSDGFQIDATSVSWCPGVSGESVFLWSPYGPTATEHKRWRHNMAASTAFTSSI